MPGCIAGQLATARQPEKAFCASKLERLHAYFLAQLIKAVLYPLFTFCAVCIRFLVHPSAQLSAVCLIMAYRAQARQKGI